jgi:hypothetical protein
MKYRLHPVGPLVTGGLVAYPFSEAADVLRYYRDVTAALPDELTAFGGLLHAPDGSGTRLVAIVVCHCGSLADGERAVQQIKSFGSPVMDGIGTIPYCDMNSMLDGGFPRGALNYWKSAFLAELSDEAIRTMIDCFAKCPTPMGALMLEHFHGAVTRVTIFSCSGNGLSRRITSLAPSGPEIPMLQWRLSWVPAVTSTILEKTSKPRFLLPMAQITGGWPRSRRSTIRKTSFA